MNSWPATLPSPSTAFAIDVSCSGIKTKSATGRNRTRSRFSRQTRSIKASFEMTDEQRTIFADFWKTSVSNGADWFNMDLPLKEGTTTHRVRFSSVSYAESHEAILNWKISVTLETEDRIEPLTADEIGTLLDAGGLDALEAAVARLHAVELEAEIITA